MRIRVLQEHLSDFFIYENLRYLASVIIAVVNIVVAFAIIVIVIAVVAVVGVTIVIVVVARHHRCCRRCPRVTEKKFRELSFADSTAAKKLSWQINLII